jgi:integrase
MGMVKKEGCSWYFQAELGKDPVTGKRKRKKQRGFKTKRDAEKALAQIEAEFFKGTYIEPSTMLYKEYMVDWFKGKKLSIGEQTSKVYENIIFGRIIPVLGNVPLSKITALQLQNYVNELKMEGLASRTVKKVFEVLRNSLEHAKDLELIQKNVATKVKLPKIEKKELEAWEQKDVLNFLQHAEPDRLYIAFYLALSTGMRQGEILGLRWMDINLEKKTLYIRQTLKHDGKGFLVGGKTKSSNRSVGLTDETVTLLKEHKENLQMQRVNKGSGLQGIDLVISTESGNPVNPANLRRSFNKIVQNSSVPRITFHGLRHTHATLLLSKGVNIKVISERLGHQNITITLNTYSHVLPTMQEEAIKQISNILG